MTIAPGGIRYSIVVPVFNEQAVLLILLRRLDMLMDGLDGPAEIIFVDDASTDCSSIILREKAKQDPRYRYIGLSRNFGHQIAITTGMDAAAGQAVIVMDADLQDPPEVIGDMIACWHDGYEIVYGRRLSRDGESKFKRWTASLFYCVLARLSSIDIPRDVGDFRLIDRKAVDAFRSMPERDRFVRGMFAWLGFRQTEVTFHRRPRFAGKTKYPFWRMLKLAVNGALSFSDAPLRLAIWCGSAVSVTAMLYGVYVMGLWLTNTDVGQRLVVDHRRCFVPVWPQHADDWNRGPLYRPHPCRGEAATALCRVTESGIRGSGCCRASASFAACDGTIKAARNR